MLNTYIAKKFKENRTQSDKHEAKSTKMMKNRKLTTRICRKIRRNKQPKYHAGASSEEQAVGFIAYL